VKNHAALYLRVYGEPPSSFINVLRDALGKCPLPAIAGNFESRLPDDYWSNHLVGLHFRGGGRRTVATVDDNGRRLR